MTIQRHRRFLPFALGQRTACRSFTFLMLLALVVIGLPAAFRRPTDLSARWRRRSERKRHRYGCPCWPFNRP